MENNAKNHNSQKTQNSQNPEDPSQEEEITQSLNEDQLAQEAALSEVDTLKAKVKEVEDKHLRLYAEFDNYRKRVAKEKEDIAFITTQRVFESILEIRDHLEMALSHTNEEAAAQTLKQGVELTLRKMDKFFETFQVKELNPQGELFNPNFHEAIQQEASVAVKTGHIVRVFQKGYVFKDRLLRPARVSVAQ